MPSKNPNNQADTDRVWQTVWLIWSGLAIASVWALISGSYSTAFFALATLAASMGPTLIPKKYGVHIPNGFIIAIVFFAFATVGMGEYFNAYEKFWWWDILLHSGSAFGFGLLGVTILLILSKRDKVDANPFILALFAFGFSISIGVIWEIFEFMMDTLFDMNMQKSGLVDTMTDLIVDVFGAAMAAVLGYRYLKLKRQRPIEQAVMANVDEAVDKNT